MSKTTIALLLCLAAIFGLAACKPYQNGNSLQTFNSLSSMVAKEKRNYYGAKMQPSMQNYFYR